MYPYGDIHIFSAAYNFGFPRYAYMYKSGVGSHRPKANLPQKKGKNYTFQSYTIEHTE